MQSVAHFRAQNATRFAVADARNQRWCPKTFETRFSQRRMKRIVRADLHALAAADAARKEVRFIDGARWPQQFVVTAFAEARVGAH